MTGEFAPSDPTAQDQDSTSSNIASEAEADHPEAGLEVAADAVAHGAVV
jgi:hypothetical protein